MSHLKLVIDHDKLDYSGPFNANNLFRMIANFLFERGFDLRQDKDFEIHTTKGKSLEWQISPWKRITDYIRYIVKVRILVHDLVKTDVMDNGKKIKVDSGRVIIIIDGFVEYDYESKWDDYPVFTFLRTVYDRFVFKIYTERFEQVLVHDINHLHEHIERFLNMNRHYTVISRGAE